MKGITSVNIGGIISLILGQYHQPNSHIYCVVSKDVLITQKLSTELENDSPDDYQVCNLFVREMKILTLIYTSLSVHSNNKN